eukprot:127913-Amphidinium_carterae.1
MAKETFTRGAPQCQFIKYVFYADIGMDDIFDNALEASVERLFWNATSVQERAVPRIQWTCSKLHHMRRFGLTWNYSYCIKYF